MSGEFYAVAAGDFNENGIPDLLMNSSSTNRAILLDGTTRVPLHGNPGTVTYVIGGDVADYNGDGHQDAVLAEVRYDQQGRSLGSFLTLYPGDGRGGFGPVRTIDGLPPDFVGIRTGDLDRDGRLDIVASGFQEVMLVRAVGFTATKQVVITAPGISGLELADVTRDGILDAVISMEGYTVFPGDGAGTFLGGINAGGSRGGSFALGDLNHDGRLDIVTDGGIVGRGDSRSRRRGMAAGGPVSLQHPVGYRERHDPGRLRQRRPPRLPELGWHDALRRRSAAGSVRQWSSRSSRAPALRSTGTVTGCSTSSSPGGFSSTSGGR